LYESSVQLKNGVKTQKKHKNDKRNNTKIVDIIEGVGAHAIEPLDGA